MPVPKLLPAYVQKYFTERVNKSVLYNRRVDGKFGNLNKKLYLTVEKEIKDKHGKQDRLEKT